MQDWIRVGAGPKGPDQTDSLRTDPGFKKKNNQGQDQDRQRPEAGQTIVVRNPLMVNPSEC